MKRRLGFRLMLGVLAVILIAAVACAKATPTPTPKPTATPTKAPTATPTATPAPGATPTPTYTLRPTATPTKAAPTNTPTPTPESEKPKGNLKIATDNIWYWAGVPEFQAPASVYQHLSIQETLFGIKKAPDGGLDWEPRLATSWSLAPDLTYADMDIRKGVKFNNWDPAWGENEMTAEDVAWSFNNANPNVNPKSVHDTAGDIAAFMKNMEVLDTYKVRMNYNVFWSHAQIRILTDFWEGPAVLSKKAFDALGAEGMRDKAIATGPFVVDDYTKAKSIKMHAAENHWRKTPYVATVEILEVPEAASRRAMLETGEVQISLVSVKEWPDLLAKGYAMLPEEGRAYGRTTVGFAGNHWEKTHYVTGEPLEREIRKDWPWVGDPDDPVSMEKSFKVRKALAMDIDREILNETVLAGLGRVFYLYEISLDDPVWDDKWAIPYDPSGAKQLLKEAGYPNGFTFELWTGPSGTGAELGEAMAAIWLSDLNVKTNIGKIVYSAFRPTIIERTATPFSCGDGNSATPADWPKGLLLSSLAAGGYACDIEDRKFAELYSAMAAETDKNKRVELAREYFDYLFETMLIVGVVETPAGPLLDPKKVIEWRMHPEGKGVPVQGINSLEYLRLAP